MTIPHKKRLHRSRMRVFALPFLSALLASASGEFECPSTDGTYANPDDCASFFQCVGGVEYLSACAPGTFFDEAMMVCNWDYMVDCGSRSDGSGDSGDSKPDTTTASSNNNPTTTTPLPTTTTARPATTTARPVTTTARPATTTRSEGDGASAALNPLPSQTMAVYLALAADSVAGFTASDDWTPVLHDYQREAANVLMLTFINPSTMEVPLSFARLAASKNGGADGSVPPETVLLFSVGGLSYSQSVNPWPWLESQAAAEAMADFVATWPDVYPGCDGIDIDIENGAGEAPGAGDNLVHFLRRLKALRPDMVVVVPTYGYPQIPAEIDAINAAWDQYGTSSGLMESIGIMVYEGTTSLDWVDEYTESASFGAGWPITADVPEAAVLVGIRGTEASAVYRALADGVNAGALGGVIVWYATVANGPQGMYDPSWDASGSADSQQGMKDALDTMVLY